MVGTLSLDRTPFARGLREARAEADAFERQKIEAKADVDTSSVSRKLSASTKLLTTFNRKRATATATVAVKGAASLTAANRQLTNFGRRRATAIAQIDTKGRKELTALSAALTAFGKRKVTAKVNVDTDPAKKALGVLPGLFAGVGRGADDSTRRTGAFSRGMAVLFGKASEAGGMLGKVGGAIQNVGQSVLGGLPLIGGMTGGLSKMGVAGVAAGAALAGTLIAAVVAAGAAIAALVASAAAGAAGLGALAIAGGGFLAGALALGIGAMGYFKKTVDQTGSAANLLRQSAQRLGGAFQKAVTPASIAVFQGLRVLLTQIRGAVAYLQPSFSVLGRAIKAALIGAVGPAESLVATFGQVVKASAPLAGPVVRGIIAIGQVLLNIARAAMPLLVSGARSVASAMQGWARSTNSVSSVRSVITSLVGHLKSWWNLAKQVGSVMVNFFRAAAPAGKSLVDSLAKGAKSLAEWLKSAQGQKAIQTFFAQMVPLVKQVATALGQMTSIILKTVAIAAPQLTFFAKLFNLLLWPINAVLTALMPLAAYATKLSASWGTAGASLTSTWSGLKGAASTAFTAIGSGVSTATTGTINLVKKGWAALPGALSSIWGGIKSGVTAAWGAIKQAIATVIAWIVATPRQKLMMVRAALTSIWNSMRAPVTAAWNAIKSTVTGAITAIRSGVTSGLGRAKAAASAAWNAMKSGALAAWNAIKSGAKTTWDAVKKAPQQALSVIKGLGGAFMAAGRALLTQLGNGIKAAGSFVANQVRDVVRRVRDLLPGSDAKTGPLSDLMRSGMALPLTLARGINAGGAVAVAAMRRMAGSLIAPLSNLVLPALSLPMIGNSGVAALSGMPAPTTRALAQAASAPPPRGLNAGAGFGRPATATPSGPTTVETHYHIPPSPAAHGQPEARDTAAKLDLYLRDRGMSFGRRGR